MFAAMGLAAALAVTPASARNTQIDPSIAMGGRPVNYDAWDSFNRARAAEQQYRMNEAAMEGTRTESDFCARWDWWGWGCSRGQHEQALQLREARAQQARQPTASQAEGVRRANESQAASTLLREQVGTLIANDDCPGAVRAALAGGDFSLAREAREFCAGTTPAPAAPK
jgi:hypothetical protein